MASRKDILASELMYDALVAGGHPRRGPSGPIFSSSSTFNAEENQTAVGTVVASGTGVTYAITGGADAAKFAIVAGTGVLTFLAAPDFEAPTDANTDNVYEVEVTATDDAAAATVQAISVTVTDVTITPSFTSPSTFSVEENEATIGTVVATGGTGFSYWTEGGDDEPNFLIDSVTGELEFSSPKDFEDPQDANADNVYEVTVGVSNLEGGEAFQDIEVTVTDVVELPAARYWRMADFTLAGGSSTGLMENSEYQLWYSGGNANASATITTNLATSFGTVADATDGTLSTRGNFTNSLELLWLRWDFGSPITITGIKVGSFDTASRFVGHIALEYSDDGFEWVRVFAGKVEQTYPGNNTLTSLYAIPQMASAGAADTFNPEDFSGFTFSNGNKTVARASGSTAMGARLTMSRNRGKHYIEIVADTIGATNAWAAGLIQVSGPLTGGYSQGAGFYMIAGDGNMYGGLTGTPSTITAGMVIQLAYDADTGKIWVGQNNTWVGGGNPAAGTGQNATATAGTRLVPAAIAHPVSAAVQWTVRTRAADFTQTMPSGFTAWSGDPDVTLDISTWDPAFKSSTITLSNSDTTATAPNDSTVTGVRGRAACSTGKKYFEIVATDVDTQGDWAAGLFITGIGLNGGFQSNGVGAYRGNGQSWTNGSSGAAVATLADGDVVGIAIDFATMEWWASKNNTWQNSGDPAAGTGELGVLASGVYFPGASTDNSSGAAAWTLRTKASQFTGTVPSGFSAWVSG